MLWDPDYNSPEFVIRGYFSDAARFRIEEEKLRSAFSTVVMTKRLGRIESIAGSIETIPHVYRDFIIRVPASYPYAPPTAHSVGWLIQGEHKYSDHEMCLWRRSQWSKKRTLAYTVAKTFTFVHKHEVLVTQGVWPGEEQPH